MSIVARPLAITSVWVTPARKADCLLNTVMSTMTISESNPMDTITSMRVKPERALDVGCWMFDVGCSPSIPLNISQFPKATPANESASVCHNGAHGAPACSRLWASVPAKRVERCNPARRARGVKPVTDRRSASQCVSPVFMGNWYWRPQTIGNGNNSASPPPPAPPPPGRESWCETSHCHWATTQSCHTPADSAAAAR